jgi:hypothetical protein
MQDRHRGARRVSVRILVEAALGAGRKNLTVFVEIDCFATDAASNVS